MSRIGLVAALLTEETFFGDVLSLRLLVTLPDGRGLLFNNASKMSKQEMEAAARIINGESPR